MRTRTRGLAAVMVAVLLLSACAGSPSQEQVRAFLDATFRADPQRGGVWLSDGPVEPTAETIAERIEPDDVVNEQQATFMRSDDYMVAVFPEGTGSRVEFDEYTRMHNRYFPLIIPFWGRFPGSYGPRGRPGGTIGGGTFRGGGPGLGK